MSVIESHCDSFHVKESKKGEMNERNKKKCNRNNTETLKSYILGL